MKKYWMVHEENKGSPIRHNIHKSYVDVCDEAKQLAQDNPGSKFAILEAIEYVVCELPEPIFYKTEGEVKRFRGIKERLKDYEVPKMRGKHPENIIMPVENEEVCEDCNYYISSVKEICGRCHHVTHTYLREETGIMRVKCTEVPANFFCSGFRRQNAG